MRTHYQYKFQHLKHLDTETRSRRKYQSHPDTAYSLLESLSLHALLALQQRLAAQSPLYILKLALYSHEATNLGDLWGEKPRRKN